MDFEVDSCAKCCNCSSLDTSNSNSQNILTHGFASPMVQVVGPEVPPLGLSKKKKLCSARFGECVGKWRENSTLKFLCFTRRSVEGKKEHAPGWEFCLAFCWAQQTLDFQGVQTISTNGEDIFKATRVSEFEFAGRMKHKTVFGWLAIRSWTWWMVDQVSPSKNKKHSTCSQTLSDPLSNSNYQPSVA